MHVIEKLIHLADAHQQADEYISGTYWDAVQRRGCSVGCTIEDAKQLGILNDISHKNHAALANATGVPELAWRLADLIFEGLSDASMPGWTPRFLRSIRPGGDYTRWPARIMARLGQKLAETAIRKDVKQAALIIANLWRRRSVGDEPDQTDWNAARAQADAALAQAYAALAQAYSARAQADAAWAQAYAARAQAYAAWEQAYAAREQADAARKQTYAARAQADAARAQADAAWEQAYAAREQAYAAREQFCEWLADVVCEELAAA